MVHIGCCSAAPLVASLPMAPDALQACHHEQQHRMGLTCQGSLAGNLSCSAHTHLPDHHSAGADLAKLSVVLAWQQLDLMTASVVGSSWTWHSPVHCNCLHARISCQTAAAACHCEMPSGQSSVLLFSCSNVWQHTVSMCKARLVKRDLASPLIT